MNSIKKLIIGLTCMRGSMIPGFALEIKGYKDAQKGILTVADLDGFRTAKSPFSLGMKHNLSAYEEKLEIKENFLMARAKKKLAALQTKQNEIKRAIGEKEDIQAKNSLINTGNARRNAVKIKSIIGELHDAEASIKNRIIVQQSIIEDMEDFVFRLEEKGYEIIAKKLYQYYAGAQRAGHGQLYVNCFDQNRELLNLSKI